MGNRHKEKVLAFHAAEKFAPNAMQSAKPHALCDCQKEKKQKTAQTLWNLRGQLLIQ